MKKFRFIFVWIPIFVYLVIISGFISESEEDLLCNEIKINILDSANVKFIKQEDIAALLSKSNNQILGHPVNHINLKELENLLINHHAIKNSELYVTEKGKLNIEIIQHKPIVRIINRMNKGYYIAEDGSVMSLTDNFSPFVVVASGYITEPLTNRQFNNILEIDTSGLNRKEKILYNIFRLVKYINKDEFWHSQIVQIYVNEKYEFELIPRVGPHIIEFGDISYYAEKFEKLKTLYLEGLNKTGWNNYIVLNLKFKNQIVCIK
jgi:cell division protein FtsQ